MELFTEADHLAEARYRKLLREQPGFAWRRFSDGEELMAYVFFPPGHEASSSVPSVLFFHGGMWVGKSLGDFVPWALHLAQQGIAGIIPMFRTRGAYEVIFWKKRARPGPGCMRMPPCWGWTRPALP